MTNAFAMIWIIAVMPIYLQLGAGRLEWCSQAALECFLDPRWVHLGDNLRTRRPSFVEAFRRHSMRYLVRHALVNLAVQVRGAQYQGNVQELYSRADFRPFVYRKGDRLPFEGGTIDYVFSEHFLEHLFFHEATALLRECHRILRPGGVVRTAVPDADLRTYEAPEPVGFPDRKLPWTDPHKHKTRWSVYLLTEALESVGFVAQPLVYSDPEGIFTNKRPSDFPEVYAQCASRETVLSFAHVQRPRRSLIVDGIRKG